MKRPRRDPDEGSRPSAARLYGLLCLMIFFWSANFIVAKFLLRHIPGVMVAGMRTTMAGVMMVALYSWNRRNDKRSWTWAEAPKLALLGLSGVAGNQLAFVLGIERTSVTHAALVIALTPLVVLVTASVIGQERLTGRKILGMAVAIGGIGVLQQSHTVGAPSSPLGDFFILLAALTFGLYTVFGKPQVLKHGSTTMTMFAYVTGAIVLLPLTLYQSSQHPLSGLTAIDWLSLLYMSLFSSIAGHLIYAYALKHMDASRVSAVSYLQPLTATVLAIPTLGEPLSGSIVSGGLLVLAGVYLTEHAP